MSRHRLLATLAVLVPAALVYLAAHRLVRDSVAADVAIMSVVILMLAVLPAYLAKRIQRGNRSSDHASRDLPAS